MPGAAVTRVKAVGRTKDSPVANRIRSWRVSGRSPVRCSATSDACTLSLLTSSTVRPLKAATSTASCSPVGHCYSRSKEAVTEAIGAIYSSTTEAFRGETFRGNTLISFGREIVSDSPLHWNLHLPSLDSTFGETDREKHFEEDPISFEIGTANRRNHFGSEKLSHSLTLSFFGFGLFRETNSAHAVMTSSRLHFTLDKTALTCCIHSLKDMQSLQSAAIRSSCTSVPRRGLQSYDA